MKICRHFRLPDQVIQGCAAGRIAFLDCGLGCKAYDPDPDPQSRHYCELLNWEGTDATLESAQEHQGEPPAGRLSQHP
jgi:hypothetical protein